MATVTTSSTCAADGHFGLSATFEAWESSTNTGGNYSTVSWHLVVKGVTTGGYTFGGHSRSHAGWVYCGVNGGTVWSGYTGFPNGMYNGQTLIDVSGSTNVAHNGDGTGSTTFFVDLDKSDDDWGKINYYFNDGPRSTGTINFTNIARASQPSINTWPNSSPDITAGVQCYVHMNRASTSFTHTVTYAFGNASGTIATGVTDNCTWIPPVSLMNQIPNSQTGAGTITVTTYNGETWIGSKSCSFTLHQPSDASPGYSVGYAENGKAPNGTALTSMGVGITTVIGGLSSKTISITGGAKDGSSTVKITCTHNGWTQVANSSSGSFTFSPVNTGNNQSYFSWAVTDSRGNTSYGSISMAYVPYFRPAISTINASRDSAIVDTGKISANGIFYNGYIGNVANSVSVSYTYNGVSHAASIGANGNWWWFDNGGLSDVSPNGNYTITVTVTDSLGASGSKQVTIAKAQSTLWIGKNTVRVRNYLIVETMMKVAGKTLLDWTHPVGSIYMSSESTDPSSLFGGTWERLKGGFIYGAVESYGAGNGSGTSTNGHTLTEDEMPAHKHEHVYSSSSGELLASAGQYASTASGKFGPWLGTGFNSDSGNYMTTGQKGGSKAHSHSIPYIAVFIWRRTA